MKLNNALFILLIVFINCSRNTSVTNDIASNIDIQRIGSNPLEGEVINSFIDPSKGTHSILYGNHEAMDCIQNSVDFTKGVILTLVTWKQKEDNLWFGAYIPGEVLLIEVIKFESHNNQVIPNYTYHIRKHKPEFDKINRKERISFITNVEKSILP